MISEIPIPKSEKNVLNYFDNPKYVVKNGHVVTLDLGRNRLTSLPESIGNLTSLTNLDLSRNYLTSLPESIGNLTSLTNLNLFNNCITSLPESIGNLKLLTNLNLLKNILISLPDSIGNLKLLKKLNLYDNSLTSLPESIRNLSSLEELDLIKNPIKTLPNLPIDLLKRLHFQSNHLTPKGQQLFIFQSSHEVREYYRKSPKKLASQYISDPKSLTKDEIERLIHEASIPEKKLLENKLPPENPVLYEIIKRSAVELHNGLKILL